MTETEKMLEEINNLLRLVGDEPIKVPAPTSSTSELSFLRQVKQEYTKRLLEKEPKYKVLKPGAPIPELFHMALSNREAELEKGRA